MQTSTYKTPTILDAKVADGWRQKVVQTSLGLVFTVRDDGISNQDLLDIAQDIAQTVDTIRWKAADLLAKTLDIESAKDRKGVKTEIFGQVAGALPWDVTLRTLENWATTARAWPLSVDPDTGEVSGRYGAPLTYSHHVTLNQAAFSIAERHELMRLAQERGWTVRELRDRAKTLLKDETESATSARFKADEAHGEIVDDWQAAQEVERLRQQVNDLTLQLGPGLGYDVLASDYSNSLADGKLSPYQIVWNYLKDAPEMVRAAFVSLMSERKS